MAENPIHLARRADLARRMAHRFGPPFLGAVVAMVAGAALVIHLAPAVGATVAAAGGVYLAASAAALLGLHRAYPHAEFGPANTVTVIRLALTAVLVAAIPQGADADAWAVPALATLSLALDGIDGWLARRTGLVSAFGARFDMEVDCLFALALAILVFASGKVGLWVLALGLARYVFWAASLVVPRLRRPLPERWSRKAVCVVQIVTLIALTSPLVQPPLAPVVAGLALILVAWSFLVDTLCLCRGPR